MILGALELEHEGKIEGVVTLPDGNPLCAKVSVVTREGVTLQESDTSNQITSASDTLLRQTLQAAKESLVMMGYPLEADRMTLTIPSRIVRKVIQSEAQNPQDVDMNSETALSELMEATHL